MPCIRETSCEIIRKNLTIDDAQNLIVSLSDEVYLVPGGYHLGEIILTGTEPAPIGISGDDIYFRFIKPCFGIFVMKMKDENAANELRTLYYSEKYASDVKKSGIRRIK